MPSWLADLFVLPSTTCQALSEVQGSIAFIRNESSRENKLNIQCQANWGLFWEDSHNLGSFSSSVDVVMFDSSSVLLTGGSQV